MISILITNYNKSKFLKKTINSLKINSYKNYEIILFDDASTDDSLVKLKEFRNIKLIKNRKKKYKSSALNQINGIIECFKKSKGNFICLLDGDDFFSKNKLSFIHKTLSQNNFDCVFNLPKIKKGKFKFEKKNQKNYSILNIFPYFVLGFVGMIILRNAGDQIFLIDNTSNWNEMINFIKTCSKIFLTMAMAAIGLSTNLKDIKNMGHKPFVVGFVSMLTVGIVSILTIEIYLKLFT